MMDEKLKICPSCGRELKSFDIQRGQCAGCARVVGDKIIVIVEKEMWVEVKPWSFTDVGGVRHKVTALQIADRIIHFGVDGLYPKVEELEKLRKE